MQPTNLNNINLRKKEISPNQNNSSVSFKVYPVMLNTYFFGEILKLIGNLRATLSQQKVGNNEFTIQTLT